MASTLFPPNSHSLSDAIIGDVVQRSSRYEPIPEHHQHDHHPTDIHSFVTSKLPKINALSASTKGGLNRVLPIQAVPRKRGRPCIVSLAKGTTGIIELELPPPRKRGRPSKASLQAEDSQTPSTRRERCRINQARYRERQRRHAVDLEKGIQELKEEIYKLELQKQGILASTPTTANVWNVAAEYFQLFRHGYIMPTMTLEDSLQRHPKSHVQLSFLQSTMTPDVTDGVLYGAEELLEHCRLLSLCFQEVGLQLEQLDKGHGDSLVATCSISLCITEDTLQSVFPHLDTSDDLPLVSKLLNQRIVAKESLHFCWDSARGRVERLESKTDLLSPLLRLLGNLEDVARVFEGALITPEGRLVSKED